MNSPEFAINPGTGALTVSCVDGFEEITTHYSPSAWQSVTHRNRGQGLRHFAGFDRTLMRR
jgi:hypothetical protein